MRKILVLIFILCAITSYSQDEVRCAGHKADGTRCKMFVVTPAKYCRFHDPSAICGAIKADGTPCKITKLPCKYHNGPMCGFIKKDGTPCRMRVQSKGQRCRFHEN